jgi:hypothetical protein
VVLQLKGLSKLIMSFAWMFLQERLISCDAAGQILWQLKTGFIDANFIGNASKTPTLTT